MISKPLRRLAILLLLLAAFFLRVYQLDSQSLRGDEAASVLYAALPVGDLWELSRVTDPHPPLYYLMLHPWLWLVGEDAWTIRFAGVIAGVLTIAALYTLIRRTLPHNGIISLFAAGLLAINPLQVWLAQDIRSYPFFTLLGLLSSIALWSALRNIKPRISLWSIYICLTIACFYLHYYTIFLIAFQGLFVVVNYRRFWKQKWPWLASQGAIGLLIIPGLQLAYHFAGGEAGGGVATLPISDILRLTFTSLLTGFTIDETWGRWTSLLLFPVWIIGLIKLLRQERVSGSFWALFFAAPVLGVIALSINRPLFKERFLIQAQPAFELLLAVGFLTLWQLRRLPLARSAPLRLTSLLRPLGFASPLCLLALLLFANAISLINYFFVPTYAKAPPWRLYHDYVNDQAQPGDVMLTNFPEASVSYYSPNDLPFYVVPAERDRSPEFRLEQTEQIANAYQRIWFLPLLRQGFDEQGDVLNWLDRHADRIDQIFFPVYNLNLYLSPPTIESRLISLPVVFANGLHLRGYQILNKKGNSSLSPLHEKPEEYLLTLKPEDEFTLSLYWQADGPTNIPYTVFVHLIAADGFNRVGKDNQPVWGSYPTTLWLPGEKITDKYTLTIPAGAPPGDHRLWVGWYDPATQKRLTVLDSASHPEGDTTGQSNADYAALNIVIRVE